MKQFHWNHIDQRGKIHKVGLLHGSNTGHVLIHVNGKISSIDFKVLDTKQYSFFIDEELIELNIIRHEDHFEYTMEINEEVKTPLNEERKKVRNKMEFQTLLFFGLMLLAIGGGTWWMMQSDWYLAKNHAKYADLENQGKFTKTKLFVDGSSEYQYQFVTPSSQVIMGSDRVPNYPIQNGDEYMVKYLPNNPDINKVYFVLPTPNQAKRAIQNGVKICLDEDKSKNEDACSCLMDAIYEIGGYKGLMSYFNRKVLLKDNSQFNGDSFRDLVVSHEYREYFLRTCE